MIYEIYTDGGCKDTIGAWAYVHIDRANELVVGRMVDVVPDTTNNRMEMIAIINAVDSLPCGSNVSIFSDSGYIVIGYYDPRYLDKWICNGWKTSKKKNVENHDLWQQILRLRCMYNLHMTLIPGHSTDKLSPHKHWNDMVDAMCTKAINEYIQGGRC